MLTTKPHQLLMVAFIWIAPGYAATVWLQFLRCIIQPWMNWCAQIHTHLLMIKALQWCYSEYWHVGQLDHLAVYAVRAMHSLDLDWVCAHHWVCTLHWVSLSVSQLILAANSFSKWGKRFEVQKHVTTQLYVQCAIFNNLSFAVLWSNYSN